MLQLLHEEEPNQCTVNYYYYIDSQNKLKLGNPYYNNQQEIQSKSLGDEWAGNRECLLNKSTYCVHINCNLIDGTVPMPKQYYYFIFIIIMTNTGSFEEVNWHNVRKKNLYELLRNYRQVFNKLCTVSLLCKRIKWNVLGEYNKHKKNESQ